MAQADDNLSNQERRGYLRVPLNVAVQCHLLREGQVVNAFECRSVDFSAGGLSLRSSQALEQGETLVVSFRLPNDPVRETDTNATESLLRHKSKLLTLRARIVWCAKRNGEQYQLGMVFLTENGQPRRPLLDSLLDYNLE
jgi:c-di-GMP-binding flagellar brake protein YcgR